MDFNTGGAGAGSGGGGGRAVSGGASGEFDYRDPVQTFIATVRGVVLRPAEFFRGILRSGDLLNPLIFALICYEVYAIFNGLFALAGAWGDQGILAFILNIVLAPIGAAIGLFIGAGILHLLVMLIVGSGNVGFEGTFRAVAYSAVVALVSWIPILGFVASLYGIYLAIVGIREVHATTMGKAALVILIPAAFFLLIGLLFAAALVAAFLSMR